MMRVKEYIPILLCLPLGIYTSRPQQASATALMPFAPLILDAAKGGVPARLLSFKHLQFLASSRQDERQAAKGSQVQCMVGEPAMCKYRFNSVLGCICRLSHNLKSSLSRSASLACAYSTKPSMAILIRPALAAAVTASELNKTSLLVQGLFSGDLEVTEAH